MNKYGNMPSIGEDEPYKPAKQPHHHAPQPAPKKYHRKPKRMMASVLIKFGKNGIQ